MKRALIVAGILLIFNNLTSCTTAYNVKYIHKQNYHISEQLMVPVGGVMIQKSNHRVFRGVDYLDDMEEIIYVGTKGDIVTLNYRQTYNKGYPVNYTHDFVYDISKSRVITLREYRMLIIEASNTSITFKVVAD